MVNLKGNPFFLDDAAIDWVKETREPLDVMKWHEPT